MDPVAQGFIEKIRKDVAALPQSDQDIIAASASKIRKVAMEMGMPYGPLAVLLVALEVLVVTENLKDEGTCQPQR